MDLAYGALRRDAPKGVAYGNRSQSFVYLDEGDELCAVNEYSYRYKSPMSFISKASSFKKSNPALPFALLTRSLKLEELATVVHLSHKCCQGK